jgi:MscS family membrane protein
MLSTLFYGNTALQWLLALSGSVLAFIAGKMIYWMLGRWAKALTRRTKTELDDIIIDQLEEPVALALTLAGIRMSVGILTMSDTVDAIIQRSFNFAIVVIAAWAVSRLYEAFHESYAKEFAAKTETDLDDYILPLVRTGVKFIVWTLAIIVGVNNAGYDVGAILAGLGIGGLAFALAAQHTFGDFVGGLNIFLDHHFKIGDRIQVRDGSRGAIDGVIEDIGIRRTTVRTRYEGRMVNIPNSIMANRPVVNVDSEDGRQIFAVYKLAPTTSHQKVQLAMNLLKEIAQGHPDTRDNTITGFVQITEISRDIMLLYWVKPEASNLKTRTTINLEILKQFEGNGIAFAENISYEYQKEVAL